MRAPAKTFVRARRLRRELTLPEVQLWILLRRQGLGARFRRQHSVGPFILDFYAPAVKLAVEIDGAAHENPAHAARDVTRDAWLERQGIHVIRFNAIEVLIPDSRLNVLDTICAVIASRT